jgi:CubicO group peptidase (beta-lactamase class C family)
MARTRALETGLSPAGLGAIRQWAEDYVDSGRLPGAHVLIARRGRTALSFACGRRSIEQDVPLARDSIFRIHSMTKPVTAAAAMRLVEENLLSLDDPVSRFIPSFADVTVNRFGGSGDRLAASPADVPMTVWHLMTHTSGLTYGEGSEGIVAELYRRNRTDFTPHDGPLAEVVERLAPIPLLFEPGTAWNYGVSSDVLGRVIEVASGMPLDRWVFDSILAPLRMTDTSFQVPPTKLDRVATTYLADGASMAPVDLAAEHGIPTEQLTLSGGGGLFSTARDYLQFAEMLRRGGTLGRVRILREMSVHLMTRNHLRGDIAARSADPADAGMTGVGYGFGISTVIDPSRTEWRTSMGQLAWGGYAGTFFFIDPESDVTAVFMTQLMPWNRHPTRSELRALVADAL